MDRGELLIVNLAYDTGHLSQDEAQVIGVIMLAEIFLACQGRPEGSLPFYIYIDECHRFLTEDIANVIMEGRKFGVHAVLMHQVLAQLREAGDFVFSAVTACRSKIVFGGLEPEDSEFMARSVFRGQFDLQRDKEKFRAPIVIGQELDWLLSESESKGIATTEGANWSEGGNHSEQQSRSATRGTSMGVSDIDSLSATRGTNVMHGSSEMLSEGTAESDSKMRAFGHTDQFNEGTSWQSAASWQAGTFNGSAQPVDRDGNPVGRPIESAGRTKGKGGSDSQGGSSQHGSAEFFYRSRDNERSAHHAARTDKKCWHHRDRQAQTTGKARAVTKEISESVGDTVGTSDGVNWSEGGNSAQTESEQQSRGRNQALRPVFQVMPRQSYTLEELIHLASVRIGNLPIGEAIVKIGRRPSSRITTVRVADGWATQRAHRLGNGGARLRHALHHSACAAARKPRWAARVHACAW